MKAVFITGHGGNEVVEIGERPRPERRPGEILIRMQAATLNRVDLYMRDSGAGITHRLPQIMGLDGAGIVEEVDASETLLTPGQRVVMHPGIACGRCEFCQRGESVLCTSIQYLGEHRDGTLTEYVSLPAQNVFPMPESLDFAEAAALGVNYCGTAALRRSNALTGPRAAPSGTPLILGALTVILPLHKSYAAGRDGLTILRSGNCSDARLRDE